MIFWKRISWLAGRTSRNLLRKAKPQNEGPRKSSSISVLAGLPLNYSVAFMPRLQEGFAQDFSKLAWQPFLCTQALPYRIFHINVLPLFSVGPAVTLALFQMFPDISIQDVLASCL